MKQLSILLAILLGFTACEKLDELDKKNANDFLSNATGKAVLEELANSYLPYIYKNAADKAALMQASAIAFSDEPTELNLTELQENWFAAYQALKYLEVHQYGSLKANFIYQDLDFWPIRKVDVNKFITDSDTITAEILKSKGTLLKGFPVMEYLLFNKDEGNAFVLSDLQTSLSKRTYLVALSSLVTAQLSDFTSAWETVEAPIFLKDTGAGLTASYNQFFNQLISQLEAIKLKKLVRPMGLVDGKLYLKDVEAYESGKSLELLFKNFETYDDVFKMQNGVYVLLDAKAEIKGTVSKSVALKKIMQDLENAAVRINGPIDEAIQQQNSDLIALIDVMTSLKNFLVLDVAQELGITITFSDNDGD